MKKTYVSPVREVYGDIRQLTRGGSGGSTKDEFLNFNGANPAAS